jgi:hypothetical protein
MNLDRPNQQLAAAVDHALALAEQRGVRFAAAFLTVYGADFALICRVLQEPTRRRVREAVAVLAEQ